MRKKHSASATGGLRRGYCAALLPAGLLAGFVPVYLNQRETGRFRLLGIRKTVFEK